jgi:hypothetical protein
MMMNYLDSFVEEKRRAEKPLPLTDKTDRTPFVSSVSGSPACSSTHVASHQFRQTGKSQDCEASEITPVRVDAPPIPREIAALPPAPCPVRGCPEHARRPPYPTDHARRERYPRDWRAPMALRPCSCGSRWWWLSGHGAIKCCACNPPVDLSLAEAWVMAREPDGRIPGEILSLLHVHAPRQ